MSTAVPASAATMGKVVAAQPLSRKSLMAASTIARFVSAACRARKGEW